MQNISIHKFNNIPKFGNQHKNKVGYTSTPTQQKPDSFEKKGLTKNQKLGIVATLIATGVLITNAIINKHNRTKAVKEIPAELKTIFEELRGEQGESFINKAYAKLKTYMKLDGIAPDTICQSNVDVVNIGMTGGFQPCTNKIGFSSNFFSIATREQQFELMAHELKHSEQMSKILRSGLIEEYADASAHSAVNSLINDPLNINFKTALDNAKANGKEKEFLEQCHNANKEVRLKDIYENHKNTLNMPKFERGSQEYKDAKRYVEAQKNYTGSGILGLATEEYLNNPLEVEAYAWGDKMAKYFRTFFGDK